MSRSWSGGSDPAWRRVRWYVLTRDRWVCQLCGRPITCRLCRARAHTPRRRPGRGCASAHHTLGRAVTGDDPRYLVAAHLGCNIDAGEPSKQDPRPRSVTSW